MKPDPVRRVLVTGSRGKSSIVRLLHAAMLDSGLRTHARITGVVPRELGTDGLRTIARSSAAHVEEMRWWLRQLPANVQAIVLENSAITPELQGLAGRWLRPEITVLSNTLPDHQEVWGPAGTCAAEVLVGGIPKGGRVIVPAGGINDPHLLKLLGQRRCSVVFAEPVPGVAEGYRAINMGLALTAIDRLGLATMPALQVMLQVKRDRYDFHVARHGGAELAMAFSANDIASTRTLFRSLSWAEQDTRLVYNHRSDRPGRFSSFVDWMNQACWREVLIIGDRPRTRFGFNRYVDVQNKESLLGLFRPGERIFGCGNIAGLPLSLMAVQGA